MKEVKVYSTPGCPFCTKVKEFLKDNGIEFENIDLSVNQDKIQEMVQKSGQMGVPVVDIEGNIVVGFDREKISRLLGL